MRSRSLTPFLVMACCTLASAARAQVAGDFSVNHFNPSERGSAWFVLDSLDLRGHLRPAAGLVADYAARSLVVYHGDGSLQASVVRNQATLHAGASLVAWDRLRVGLDAPVQIYADGHTGDLGGGVRLLPPAHSTALGDFRLSADARLFGEYGAPVTVAAGASLWLPTGDPKSYSGDPTVRVAPHALVAGELGLFVYSGSLGLMYRDIDGFGRRAVGTEVTLGAAVGVSLLDRKLIVGPELFGDTVVSHSTFSKRATPFEGLLGAHYTLDDTLRFGGGIGTGLVRGYGAPNFRGLISVEWVPAPGRPPAPPAPAAPRAASDRDHDGVADAADACPDTAGVPSSQAATNGCPAAVDTDGDGVADASDACPAVAGVASSEPKTNGCPAPADADGDGVLDADDACPAVAGAKTADPKTNGCPDPDRDQDGIANESDACPDEAGQADADPKRNGCPKAFVKDGQIKIQQQVMFGYASGVLLHTPENEEVLSAVLAVLQQHPEIKGLSIEGYSDSVGKADENTRLSKRRAAAVLNWLVAHGVDAKRLRSEGFGPEKPIDTNDTPAGRANNRRVEFHVLDATPDTQGHAP